MKMKIRTKTIIILAAVTAGLILWDIYCYKSPEQGDTISRIIFELSRNIVLIPFGLGVLMGHFFIPGSGKWKIISLSAVGTFMLGLSFFHLDIPAIIPFGIGVFMGWYCWSMNRKDKGQ